MGARWRPAGCALEAASGAPAGRRAIWERWAWTRTRGPGYVLDIDPRGPGPASLRAARRCCGRRGASGRGGASSRGAGDLARPRLRRPRRLPFARDASRRLEELPLATLVRIGGERLRGRQLARQTAIAGRAHRRDGRRRIGLWGDAPAGRQEAATGSVASIRVALRASNSTWSTAACELREVSRGCFALTDGRGRRPGDRGSRLGLARGTPLAPGGRVV